MVLEGKNFFVPGEFPVMVEHLPYKGVPFETRHSHDFSELTIVLTGKADHVCGTKVVALRAEDVLLLHPGVEHAFDNTSGFSAISLLYDANVPYPPLVASELELIREIYPDPAAEHPDPAEPLTVFPACDFSMMMNLLLRLRYEIRHKRQGHRTIVMAIFCEIIAYLSRGYSPRQELRSSWLLKRATDYLDAHYNEKISIGELSRKVGMSERSLYLEFRRMFHSGPYDYLIKIRTFRAFELLCSTRLSISEIAIRTGFYDSNQFCKLFKKQHGLSPKHFRQIESGNKSPERILADR